MDKQAVLQLVSELPTGTHLEIQLSGDMHQAVIALLSQMCVSHVRCATEDYTRLTDVLCHYVDEPESFTITVWTMEWFEPELFAEKMSSFLSSLTVK